MNGLLLLALLTSCSFFKASNEKAEGHNQLYSMPDGDGAVSVSSSQRRLVIVSTNDLRGQLEARQETAEDKHSHEKTLISVGGVEVFARYMHILRSKYPKEVLLVDAGNSLSGTLGSRTSGAKSIVQHFARLKYDAIGVAAADLAAGPDLKKSLSPGGWMQELFKLPATPVLIRNLVDLKTTQPVQWGSSVPQLMKEVNGVQVGMLGLLPDDLPAKLDAGVLNGLYVEPAFQSFLKQSRSLRLKGAEVIILVMHGGLKCGLERAESKNLPLGKVNFDPQDPDICDREGALYDFLSQLPAGSVDLVITGGGPGKIANMVNGIPVVQAMGLGTAFARVDLVWDTKNKKLLNDKIRLHQPVRLCHRFFKETEDCYTEDPSVDHRGLIPARYLDQDIMPDAKTAEWMQFWREQVIAANEPLLDNDNAWSLRQEAAQAVLVATSADAAVVGGRHWSLTLPAGVTTWRDLFSQRAAREKIQLVTMTGSELAQLRQELTGQLWWANKLSWEELAQQPTVVVAVNASLWALRLKPRSEQWNHSLASMVIADTIVSWEKDEVALRSSGRAPALPHTQP